MGTPGICSTIVNGGPKQVNNKPNAARSTPENFPLIYIYNVALGFGTPKNKQTKKTRKPKNPH